MGEVKKKNKTRKDGENMPAIKKLPEQERSEAITKRLKIALLEKGWTQEHLAKLTGHDQRYISRLMNEPLKRDLGDILYVSDKLGVRLLSDEICKR